MIVKRQTYTSYGFESAETNGFFRVAKVDSALAIAKRLTASQLRLWLYLMMIDPFADQTNTGEPIYHNVPTSAQIAQKIGASVDTVEKDLRKIDAIELLPKWLAFKRAEYAGIEHQIRDRLKAKLGGQVEINTAVGRIDLLTAHEVIEIKNIRDWKGALGQILAYSAFFPEHSKRIHLFGRPDLSKLALAQATCSEFGITVTFEEVSASC